MNLATYVLMDAFNKDSQAAIVITNDSDLAEPLKLARTHLGMTVGVVNPHPPKSRSRDLSCTFFKQLRASAVTACQFPHQLTDGQGTFQKPSKW